MASFSEGPSGEKLDIPAAEAPAGVYDGAADPGVVATGDPETSVSAALSPVAGSGSIGNIVALVAERTGVSSGRLAIHRPAPKATARAGHRILPSRRFITLPGRRLGTCFGKRKPAPYGAGFVFRIVCGQGRGPDQNP
jgi:hypothetical protein